MRELILSYVFIIKGNNSGGIVPFAFIMQEIMTNKYIKNLLTESKIIAVVGFSDNFSRPSNRIGRYLHGNGYKVFGINPKLEKKTILDIECFDLLKQLPVNADIVNIFRRSEFLRAVIDEILELNYKPRAVWTQIGVIDYETKIKAEENGIFYVENKCIMTEHQFLF